MDTPLERRVRVIPATKPKQAPVAQRGGPLRVAAYCRVSTDSDEQINSYKAQKDYYTQLISESPEWKMAGIYADEGISGVSMKKRGEFNRMIAACKRGRIDMILTKSLSRFARNTVECLETVRMLRGLGITVKFEKENIDTLTEPSEFMIALHSSFAQAEIESLSKNVSWGIRNGMRQGKVAFQYDKMLGYQRGPDGQPEIVPEQAEIVRNIYRSYLGGSSIMQIKTDLERQGIPSPMGSKTWSVAVIRNVLTNEKYMGDALLQKTFVADCISKKVYKNTGELPMYYVEDNHSAIIPKVVFQQVQSEMSRRACKREAMPRAGKKAERSKYSGKYALTERLVCGECGSPYKRCTWNIRGKKKIVWRCVSRLENGKRFCHNSPTVDEDKLHQAIMQAINEYAGQAQVKQLAAQCAEKAIRICESEDVGPLELDAKLEDIRSRQKILLDMILENMDDASLLEQMKELESQRQRLQEQMRERQESAQAAAEEDRRRQEIRAWLEQHPAGLREYDDKLVRKTIQRITVQGKTKISVEFYGDDTVYEQEINT